MLLRGLSAVGPDEGGRGAAQQQVEEGPVGQEVRRRHGRAPQHHHHACARAHGQTTTPTPTPPTDDPTLVIYVTSGTRGHVRRFTYLVWIHFQPEI